MADRNNHMQQYNIKQEDKERTHLASEQPIDPIRNEQTKNHNLDVNMEKF